MRDAARNRAGCGIDGGIGAGGNWTGDRFISVWNDWHSRRLGKPGRYRKRCCGSKCTSGNDPAEAAILKVQKDIVAAITAGDLKARKLGSAYRISKEALEEFLKG
jgi:excisionase family DNA binding protein